MDDDWDDHTSYSRGSLRRNQPLDLATPWTRAVALLIDLLILAGAGLAPFIISWQLEAPMPALGLISIACALTYFVMLEGSRGKTIGKSVMRLRVVSMNGSRVTASEALVRNIGRLVDMQVAGLVGLVVMLVSSRRQRLGDIAAGTIVVQDL